MGCALLGRFAGHERFRLGSNVTTLDAADAEESVNPVAWFGGDDRAQSRSSPCGGQRHAVADGDKPIWAVDDEGHEIPARSGTDKRVTGNGGEGALSRKCNHGRRIGRACGRPSDLYG